MKLKNLAPVFLVILMLVINACSAGETQPTPTPEPTQTFVPTKTPFPTLFPPSATPNPVWTEPISVKAGSYIVLRDVENHTVEMHYDQNIGIEGGQDCFPFNAYQNISDWHFGVSGCQRGGEKYETFGIRIEVAEDASEIKVSWDDTTWDLVP